MRRTGTIVRAAIASALLACTAALPFTAALAQDEDDPPRWSRAMLQRMQTASHREARQIAERMMVMIEREPRLLDTLLGPDVAQVRRGLEAEAEFDVERRLLAVLVDGGWRPADEIEARPNWYDARLALLLIEAGDVAGAAAVVETTDWLPSSLIRILTDRRYESIWATLEASPRADLAAAAEREIAAAERLAALYTTRIEPHRMHIAALRHAGRAADAVQAGEAVLAEMSEPGSPPPYDQPAELTDTLQELAFAYANLGEMDRAHATLAAAADEREVVRERYRYFAMNNVSQTINSAYLLMLDARPDEARDRLGAVDSQNLSEFGEAVVVSIRACIAAQRSDSQALEDALWRLEGYETLFPSAAELGYLCAERIESAVALTIRRLENEGQRSEALWSLQRLRSPDHLPAYQQLLNERHEQIRTDPRVLEALEPYGRILSWEVTG